MRRFYLLPWLLLLTLPSPSHAQSRRLHQLWVTLAHHSLPGLAREQALWNLAWEKEVSPPQQDSLARVATALAWQLRDPAGQLAGQIAAARRQLVRGQRAAAQATLLPVLAEARRRGDAWLQVLALIILGRTYWGTAQHPRALSCWQQAWAAAQHQPDPYWRVRTAILQGNFYDNYALGLRWYFRGLRLAQQLDCQVCQADALGGIGYDYLQLRELGLAEHYLRQDLAVQQQVGNRTGEGQTLISLAGLHLERRRYPAAEAALRRATALATTAADSLAGVAGLASALAQRGQDVQAQAQARRGLLLAKRLGNIDQLTFLEATLAGSYLQQGRVDSALRYGRRAYAHRQRGAERQVLASTCQLLARTYARRGDFAQAYAFQGRATAYTDTLTNNQIRTQAAQARYTYQLERQQRQLAQFARDEALGQLRQQRQLAVGGLLLLVAMGAGALALARLRQRQRRRLATLREQIAADLHDEVGGLLTQLALEGATLRHTQPTTPAQARHLDRVAEVSQLAARQLRDVVWSIDTRHDSLAALLDHLRDYLHELLGTADLEAEFVADPALATRPLALPVRDALYFVFKEALHNVVKHARAQQVRVQLRLAGSTQLELTIDDDGVELSPAQVAPELPTRGLSNMRRRASAAGGQLGLESSPQGGLRVQLRLPLR